jgi:hypothetical protein
MANFAVIENGIVTNVIVANSKEKAEEGTGKTCVEYFESNPAIIGLGYNGIHFEQYQPDQVFTGDWADETQMPGYDGMLA